MTTATQLWEQAQKRMPGGVNSPVRAFRSVGGNPLFLSRGKGPWVYDLSGRQYIDYVGAWGPAIVGHAHADVCAALKKQLQHGLGFGAPHETEVQLAEMICDRIPSLQQLRMVNSGTEATMTAIRLARAATERQRIIKFSGGYHGHADSLLVEAGSGAADLAHASSPGVPESLAALSCCAEYNDPDSVARLFEAFPDDIACVIVEPIAGNMGCIPPQPGFLEALRLLCDRYRALLIFDEVMCGFRVGPGSAQQRYGVTPDLTVLGKIIGGGLPVGAFGGSRKLMELMAPEGPVYQAGTLSGNPLAMSAGIATLKLLAAKQFYPQLERHTEALVTAIADRAAQFDIAMQTHCVGGMFGLFFTGSGPVHNYQQVRACDTALFRRFFHGMLARGVYLAPSPFEAGFVSAAHDDETTAQTLAAAEAVFATMTREEP